MSRFTRILPIAIAIALVASAGCKTASRGPRVASIGKVAVPAVVASTIVDTAPMSSQSGNVALTSGTWDIDSSATTNRSDSEPVATLRTVSLEEETESQPESRAGSPSEASSDSDSNDDSKQLGLPTPVVIESVEIDAVPSGHPLSVSDAVHAALAGNKSIMVLGYAPQEAATLWSTERAAFDPVIGISARGAKYDRQLASFIDSGGVIPSNLQQTDLFGPTQLNNLSISQLLESGGIIEAGLGTNYLYQDPVGGLVFLNPSWRSAVNFQLTQPLGRGRGRSVTTAPLRIAQTNSHRAAHDFQASVNVVVRDVQLAYWNWKLAQRQYEVRSAAVAQAAKTVEIEKERLKLDEGTLPDVQQSQEQWQRFKVDALLAKNGLAQAKLALARLLGKSTHEMFFSVAADEPETEADFVREIGEVNALGRPEVMAIQSSIRAAEIEVVAAANSVRPDLNMKFNYAVTGLEARLDDSFGTVFDNRFNDWILGIDYKRAVGLRAAHANLRRSRIHLARARAERDRVELEIINDVAFAWNDLQTRLEALQIQRERVEIAKQLLAGRDELYNEGEATLDLKIRSESLIIDAKLAELESEVAVQQAIVQWEYVTCQQYYVEFLDK